MTTRFFRRTPQLGQPQPTRPLIAFRLQDEWFALPIFTVDKVMPLSDINDHPQRAGMGLTLYQDRDLLVIDIPGITDRFDSNSFNFRFLLVLATPTEPKMGLLINSLPVLHQVLDSAFRPIKSPQTSQNNLRCLADCRVQIPDQPPLLMLNLEKLMSQVKKLF